ncbi:MAG: YfhO family protein [bacterium]
MPDSPRVRPGSGPVSGASGIAAFTWILYVPLAALFLHDAVSSGGAYLLRDILTFFHPWQSTVREAVRAGALPFWSHDAACGTPLLANLQSGVFYPPNWLYWFLSFDVALTTGMLLHLALGGILMRAFLRRAGLDDPAAFFGGAAFAFGTWTLAHLEAPMKLGAAVWIPLAWIGTWEAMREGRRRGLGLVGLAIALSLLAGYPQITALGFVSVSLLAFVLGIELLITKDVPLLEKAKRFFALPAALALAALVAGVQLAPTREMLSASGKIAPYPIDVALTRSLPPKGLVGLLDPFFLGLPGVDRYWGADAIEFPFSAIYVGALAVLLAAAAFPAFRQPRRPRRVRREDLAKPVEAAIVPRVLPTFLLLGALAGTALALGRFGGAWTFLHTRVPGFASFRWPATADFLVSLHVAGLAAVGLACVLREESRWRILSVAAVFLGATFLVVAAISRGPLGEIFRAIQLAGSPPYQQQAYAAGRDAWAASLAIRGGIAVVAGALAFALAGRGLTLGWAWSALLLLDLFAVGRMFGTPVARGFYDSTPKEVAALRDDLAGRRVYTPGDVGQLGNFLAGCRNPVAFAWAKHALLANANVPAGIGQVQPCDPLSSRRQDAFPQIYDSPMTPDPVRQRILDLWDVARVVHLNDVRPLEVPAIQDPERGLSMVAHEPRLGRATLLTGWETVGGDGRQTLDRLLAPDHDPARTTLLEAVEGVRPPNPANRPADGPCDAIEYETFPNRIRVAWHVGQGGMLRVLESWAPGWHARVNGDPAPVYRADFLFLAVPVPAGSVTVELEYRPAAFPVGIAASAAGLLGLCLCFAGGSRKKVAATHRHASARAGATHRPIPSPPSTPSLTSRNTRSARVP